MIQRIQSVYLLLTTLLSVLFLNGNIINFIGSTSPVSLAFNGVRMYSGGEEPEIVMTVMPFSILLMLVPLVSVIAIFLYKNRKLQLKLVIALILLIIAVITLAGYYIYSVINSYDSELMFGYKLVLPVLMLIFSILAYRGIKKDEELVRSYDRLR